MDRQGRAINANKNTLLSELDDLNPDYKAARQAYGQYAGQAAALRAGAGTLPQGNVPMRNFDRLLGSNRSYDAGLSPEQATLARVPELQRGYATWMADTADKARLSADPYASVYGSPLQQSKVASLFPEGAPQFDRIAQLERNMALTNTRVLGGSLTQANREADARLSGSLGDLTNAGLSLAHGNVTGAGAKALSAVSKGIDKSVSEDAANKIAPLLYNTDPAIGLQYLAEMQKRQQMRGIGARLLAVPSGAGLVSVGTLGGSDN